MCNHNGDDLVDINFAIHAACGLASALSNEATLDVHVIVRGPQGDAPPLSLLHASCLVSCTLSISLCVHVSLSLSLDLSCSLSLSLFLSLSLSPPCHCRVLILQLCSALAGMSSSIRSYPLSMSLPLCDEPSHTQHACDNIQRDTTTTSKYFGTHVKQTPWMNHNTHAPTHTLPLYLMTSAHFLEMLHSSLYILMFFPSLPQSLFLSLSLSLSLSLPLSFWICAVSFSLSLSLFLLSHSLIGVFALLLVCASTPTHTCMF